jgi:predicted MFS family arabinose efflux permease
VTVNDGTNTENLSLGVELGDVASTSDSRWLALVVLCSGLLMIILDQTIVNVALPSIQSDLGFSQSSLAWVVNAYLIAFGGLLLLAGRLGDLIGRKHMFIAGMTLFTFASLLCGLSWSPEILVATRFVQGRRRYELRRDPGHDRDTLPGAP